MVKVYKRRRYTYDQQKVKISDKAGRYFIILSPFGKELDIQVDKVDECERLVDSYDVTITRLEAGVLAKSLFYYFVTGTLRHPYEIPVHLLFSVVRRIIHKLKDIFRDKSQSPVIDMEWDSLSVLLDGKNVDEK